MLSDVGRHYRTSVATEFVLSKQAGLGASSVRVKAIAYLPDRRRRDLDNLGKAVYDALQAAQVFVDDSQIVDAHWVKGPVDRDNPRIEVTVEVA